MEKAGTIKLRHLATLLTALATSTALPVFASSAAAERSYPTTITYDSSTRVGPDVYLDSGRVHSPKRVCEFLRVVKVIAHGPYVEPPGLLDYDLTSYFGAWSTKDRYAGVDSAKAYVTRHRFRQHGRHIICEPASVKLR